jgi:hypothetical protein
VQAKHFLEVVQPGDDTVIVLDFESNPAGPSMTLEQAHAFVTHIKAEVVAGPGFTLATTSRRRLASQSIPFLRIVGSGWRNMARGLLFLSPGKNGPCGNTPTAV